MCIEDAAAVTSEPTALTVDWFGTPMTPLAGGYSGETFLVGTDTEPDGQVVLRIYARRPDRLAIDVSLLRLLEGVLPVPRVVDVRLPHGALPGVLVTGRVPGERVDLVLAGADADLRAVLGRNVGSVLAALSGMPMLTFGLFADADLHLSAEGLPKHLGGWVRHFREQGRLSRWSTGDYEALMRLASAADELFMGPLGSWSDETPGPELRRHVLVHGDFNPKNLLADPTSGEVTGVLDWEFAHAGSPYSDLGNLTRFERQPDFVAAVLETFVARAPLLVPDPLMLGRASDLWALIELAGRAQSNAVQRTATTLLLSQAREADLNAWPWSSPRVDPTAPRPLP